MMSKPKIIVLSGYGLNCEEETAMAFTLAGGQADIVHINDLIAKPKMLLRYQILAIPGGFSYGDDLGGGRAYANKLNNRLKKQLAEFAKKDKLILGICNGFQILTQAGMLPGVLTFNNNNRYTDRWVDVKINSKSPWLKGIKKLCMPIAHGEGKFVAESDLLNKLKKQKQIVGVYYKGEVCAYQNLAPNPNGSMADVAILTSADGKIIGIMPHPERAMFFTQSPMWPLNKEKLVRAGNQLPKFSASLQIFKNAVNYFSAKGGSAFGGK